MPVTLTGYGGVGEIGGNAFLLKAGKESLFLDFGKRFGTDTYVEKKGNRPGWNDYFDQYLKPRNFSYVHDLATLGIIPNDLRLYRQDLGGSPDQPPVGGVLLTHAHMDHCGLIGLLKPNLPIHCSDESRAILASIEATGGNDPENEFLTPTVKGKVGRKKDGELTPKPQYVSARPRAFSPGNDNSHEWKIERHRVDHSIPGALAYVITNQVSIAYTGDFRLHGRNRTASEKFIERSGQVDFLLTEGTNVHGGDGHAHGHAKSTDNETSVEAAINECVERQDALPDAWRTGFVGIGYPPRDYDRLQSILAVARNQRRSLVITTKQAHLLDTMRHAGADVPDPFNVGSGLRVYLDASGKGTILHAGKSTLPVAGPDLSVEDVGVDEETFGRLLRADYSGWEASIVERALKGGTSVTAADVGRDSTAFLFSINFWSIKELFDIFPDPARANGLYIHSSTQPFNDDMEQNDRKLNRWLKAFNLERTNTHVSGHLGQDDLAWVLDQIQPRHVVPIHSDHPQATAKRFQDKTGRSAVVLKPLSETELAP